MTDIVSATGTYQWYWSYESPRASGPRQYIETPNAFDLTTMELALDQYISGYRNRTDTATLALLVDAVVTSQLYRSSRDVDAIYTYRVGTDSNGIMPTTVTGPFPLLTGETYDTGVVQIYGLRITEERESVVIIDDVLNVMNQKITYSGWTYYAPTSASPVTPPVPTPPDAELQLRLAGQKFYAEDNSILPKYTDGTTTVRGTYASGTKIGVIAQSNNGGFLIYEEVGGVPSGTVYVYTNERKLRAVVPASDIGQYLI